MARLSILKYLGIQINRSVMDRILETLKKLVFAHGPPGLEDEVRDVILEEIMDSAER